MQLAANRTAGANLLLDKLFISALSASIAESFRTRKTRARPHLQRKLYDSLPELSTPPLEVTQQPVNLLEFIQRRKPFIGRQAFSRSPARIDALKFIYKFFAAGFELVYQSAHLV